MSIKKCSVELGEYQTRPVVSGSGRRTLSTLMQSQILSVSFSFKMDVTCDSNCNVAAITEALQQSVTQVIGTSIDDNSLLSQVESASGGDISIISDVTIEPDPCPVCNCSAETETDADSVDTSDSSNESLWYPAWGVLDKCSNAPGMPAYMSGSSHYTSECTFDACVFPSFYSWHE